MPLWNRVKQELDRAGKAAQDAIDEGKVRLEAFRARQLADKAAQALGYALYRSRTAGAELEASTYERLRDTLATHEAEATRLEAQLEGLTKGRKAKGGESTTSAAAEPPPPPPAGDAGASSPPP